MSSYLDFVKQTYIENWPAALCRLSIAQVDVPLTLEEARAMGRRIIEFGEAFGVDAEDKPVYAGLCKRVTDAVATFPRGAFLRLGSRSPKDSWLGERTGFRVDATDPQPLRFFLDASERTYEDLTLCIGEGYAPHIFVREWVEIPKAWEFRCFMRDRKLVGISQYNYHDHQPEAFAERESVKWAIEQFFPEFRAASHLDDVVFDVVVSYRTMFDSTRAWKVKLLEINPFSGYTDPCLFDWRDNGDSLDGSIKVTPESGYRRPPPPPMEPCPPLSEEEQADNWKRFIELTGEEAA